MPAFLRLGIATMSDTVQSHYGRQNFAERIFDALREEGKDPDHLAPEDLTPVDQFHIGGKPESEALLVMAGFETGSRILDIGSGIGGPARFLAQAGFSVTGIDLTPEFCSLAGDLTARCGLSDKVRFVPGDATDMPFEGGEFDGAWIQHVNMNIADKRRLFREIARVLRPGGKLAFHEVCQGEVGEVIYPTPWASRLEISFLATLETLRSAIENAGLSILEFEDRTNSSAEWFEAVLQRQAQSTNPKSKIQNPKSLRPLGLHLLLGPEAPTIVANMVRNLNERRVRVVMGVASL